MMCATALPRPSPASPVQRPRPAYLELPLDLLKLPAGDGWTARRLPSRPHADADAIAEAAARSWPASIRR